MPKTYPNSGIPELEHEALIQREKVGQDTRDSVGQHISPEDPSTMSRAEDDPITYARSPEYHDRPSPTEPDRDASKHKKPDWA